MFQILWHFGGLILADPFHWQLEMLCVLFPEITQKRSIQLTYAAISVVTTPAHSHALLMIGKSKSTTAQLLRYSYRRSFWKAKLSKPSEWSALACRSLTVERSGCWLHLVTSGYCAKFQLLLKYVKILVAQFDWTHPLDGFPHRSPQKELPPQVSSFVSMPKIPKNPWHKSRDRSKLRTLRGISACAERPATAGLPGCTCYFHEQHVATASKWHCAFEELNSG